MNWQRESDGSEPDNDEPNSLASGFREGEGGVIMRQDIRDRLIQAARRGEVVFYRELDIGRG